MSRTSQRAAGDVRRHAAVEARPSLFVSSGLRRGDVGARREARGVQRHARRHHRMGEADAEADVGSGGAGRGGGAGLSHASHRQNTSRCRCSGTSSSSGETNVTTTDGDSSANGASSAGSAGPGGSRRGGKLLKGGEVVPLPITAREMVEQTAQCVDEAEFAGAKRQVIEWLLPVNQRRPDFLNTDPTRAKPTSVFDEFKVANTLATVLLEGTGEREITVSRLDDGYDSEPVSVVKTDDNRYIAIVFPTSDVIDRIRELADGNPDSTILLINPQWTTQGNIVSDFGFGFWRKRAEEVLAQFETTYCLFERRIGNNLGPNFMNGVRGVVRLVRLFRRGWQVHVMSSDIGALRQPVVSFKGYPSYQDLCTLLNAYELKQSIGMSTRPSNEGARADAPGNRSVGVQTVKKNKRRPFLFSETEIKIMDARMLTAALLTVGLNVYTKGDDGKSRNLTTEEMRDALILKQEAMKQEQEQALKSSGKGRRGRPPRNPSAAAPQACRVCDGSGIRKCNLCASRGSKYGRYVVDLSCPLCGGHSYVICPACQGQVTPPKGK